MISIITITIAIIYGSNFNPIINEITGIIKDKIIYVFDLYSQRYKGSKWAPKIMAITISIFSGTVG